MNIKRILLKLLIIVVIAWVLGQILSPELMKMLFL